MRYLSQAVLVAGLTPLVVGCARENRESTTQEGAGLEVREGLIDAGQNVQIFYRAIGSGGDTLVVIHGGPGFNMDYFAADLEPLADRLTLIFYDQRGTGRSTLVSDSAHLSGSLYAEDLEAIRSHFGLEHLALLGHSWGAGVVALYAMRYPTRVNRLLIVDGVPLHRAILTSGFQQMQASRDSAELTEMEELRTARLAAPENADACRAYYMRWFRPFFVDSTAMGRSRGDFCSGTTDARRNMAVVNQFTMASLGEWDWRDSLRDLSAPTLVIHGTADPIPVSAAREWANVLPNARLLLLDRVGHFPYLEAPDQFFPAVRDFVEGNWPKGARLENSP